MTARGLSAALGTSGERGRDMKDRFDKSCTRGVIAFCALAATIGLVTFASAQGGGAGTPSQDPSATSEPVDAAAAAKLLELEQSQHVGLIASRIRAVPAPRGAAGASTWTIAPTEQGGACVNTGRVMFCGRSEESSAAGRASATTYPADEAVGPDSKGRIMVKPSGGTGVRSGLAPSGTVEVRVVDGHGAVVRSEPIADGVYEVVVPAQGTRAQVVFVDASGNAIATRPAEG